jgi:hypothetical protein
MSDLRGAVDLGVRTPMQRAHADGMRRARALLKNRLVNPAAVDTTIADALKLYLREWSKMYDAGTRAQGLDQTERTMLFLRHDTLLQMAAELEKVGSEIDGEQAVES